MTIVRFTQETLWILITICSLIYTGNIMDPDHYCLIYTGNIMDPDHYSFYDAKLRDIVTSWLHL